MSREKQMQGGHSMNNKASSPLPCNAWQRLELPQLMLNSWEIIALKRVKKEGETPREAAWGRKRENPMLTWKTYASKFK